MGINSAVEKGFIKEGSSSEKILEAHKTIYEQIFDKAREEKFEKKK